MNTQAAVGTNLIILDLATGYPGSLHDSSVLRNRNIFLIAEKGDVLSCPDSIIENTRISPLILYDGGYDLMKGLVTHNSFPTNLTATAKK